MNLDLFLIQNDFEEFNFRQKYFYLAQLHDTNPILIRNPNTKWIQDNNESRSTTRNPSLTMNHDVAWNPTPKRIQDAIRNLYPTKLKTL